ncbi:hypothetical protein FRC17_010144 [Serendipita sp. 399]|nr:hypothetical protein FRC17_010144 [Serendipita sp. 399]
MASKRSIVAVIGTTGAGKSKLAVDIAKACDGEIINADAMQVYRGLDVITNKVTKEEMQGIPHHLMDYKEPGEETFVAEWVSMAIHTIDAIYTRGRLPIIVGGTSYWLQNLLFSNRIVADTSTTTDSQHPSPDRQLQAALNELTSDQLNLYRNLPERPPTASTEPEDTYELWKLLEALDPEMAQRWHWKDSRKVLRNLEIMVEHGKLASEIIKQQDKNLLESRYRSLIFWPYSERTVLDVRLDKRVGQMVQNGLLDEIKTIPLARDLFALQGLQLTVPIGFKEFNEYLQSSSEAHFEAAVDAMKRATRKYAVYQTKWNQRKFLPLVEAVPDAYAFVLDTTDPEEWSKIEKHAVELTTAFLAEEDLPSPVSITSLATTLLSAPVKANKPSDSLSLHKKIQCDICTKDPNEPFLVTETEWGLHLKSRIHQRTIAGRKRREQNMQYLMRRNLEEVTESNSTSGTTGADDDAPSSEGNEDVVLNKPEDR